MAGKLPSLTSKAVIYENCSDDDDNEDTGNDHHLGLSLEKLNLGPRKKLLVLGLGGLLVQRVYSRYGVRTNVQTRRRPDGIAGNFLVFNRPYCSEFLKFCFERFEVGIWSSIFLKEMKKLWEDRTLPWPCGQYSSSNTLLIDDDPCKALLNPVIFSCII